MNRDDKASISLKKLISVSVILLFVMGIAVMAASTKITNAKIILADGYEVNVLTSKNKVSEILDENHIVLLPNEVVTPSLEDTISDNKTIRISKNKNDIQVVSEQIEKSEDITVEQLLEENYDSITEKIVTHKISIPYETITKNVATGTNTKEVVVQKGIDGEKKVVYKIKYKNNEEIEKIQISENIIKQPTSKIIEIRTANITSRTLDARTIPTNTSVTSLASKVEGITPTVKSLNASAYTASTCGKSPTSAGYGITSSGAKATAYCTVAAGSGYPIGTIIYIPYFANMPNGGWFIVQDRGGAISNNKIDIYMDTYNDCIKFGRRNIECYIYQFN